MEEYKKSDEFKKITSHSSANPEEEENKKDPDPEGFLKYNDLVSKIALICRS